MYSPDTTCCIAFYLLRIPPGDLIRGGVFPDLVLTEASMDLGCNNLFQFTTKQALHANVYLGGNSRKH